MKLSVRRCLTGMLTLGLALVAACGDVESPGPVAAGTTEVGHVSPVASKSANISALARFESRPQITIAWAKKWIGPEGGRLDFYGFAIDVPPGAVKKVTQFSIRLPVDPQASDYVMAEFGPHGTFDVPVAIELPYAGTSAYGESGASVVWWNPDVGAWADVGGSVTADGERLRTETDHFSTYGTTTSRGDGVVMSGG